MKYVTKTREGPVRSPDNVATPEAKQVPGTFLVRSPGQTNNVISTELIVTERVRWSVTKVRAVVLFGQDSGSRRSLRPT